MASQASAANPRVTLNAPAQIEASIKKDLKAKGYDVVDDKQPADASFQVWKVSKNVPCAKGKKCEQPKQEDFFEIVPQSKAGGKEASVLLPRKKGSKGISATIDRLLKKK